MHLDPKISGSEDPAPKIKDPIRIRIRKKSWIRPSLLSTSVTVHVVLISVAIQLLRINLHEISPIRAPFWSTGTYMSHVIKTLILSKLKHNCEIFCANFIGQIHTKDKPKVLILLTFSQIFYKISNSYSLNGIFSESC